jgi:hypothetical protein
MPRVIRFADSIARFVGLFVCCAQVLRADGWARLGTGAVYDVAHGTAWHAQRYALSTR